MECRNEVRQEEEAQVYHMRTKEVYAGFRKGTQKKNKYEVTVTEKRFTGCTKE